MEGYIKLHRQIQESFLWMDKPFARGQAWIDLLMLAWHKDTYFFARGIKIPVARGQLAVSTHFLEVRWSWGKTKVKNFLNLLENEKQISQQKNNVITLITILNYDRYQTDQTADETPSQTANVHQTSTKRPPNLLHNNNVKNEKKENTASAYTYVREEKPNMLFPESLNNEDFYKAWELWENHYKNVKHKLITPQQRDVQLMRLARVGSEKAISMIENSIAKGWLDIYELDEKEITDPSEARRKAFEEL